MRRLLLAPLLLTFSIPVQAADPAVHLVLAFSRGPGVYGSMSSVSMPMASMDQCQEEGALATTRNKKEYSTYFWCVDGGVQ